MTINKVINKLYQNLNEDEIEFLNYVRIRLKNFNNIYLLTKRFINKIEDYTDEYLKTNNINSVDKYHYYATIGFKFKILTKEVEWCNINLVENYKHDISKLGLEEDIISDTDAINEIQHNVFYNLLFTLKLTKGDNNE